MQLIDIKHKNRSLNDRDDVTKHIKSKSETIYSFFVEFLSTADGGNCINKMKKSCEISFMLLFMISPYLVSHSIMCPFQVQIHGVVINVHIK